MNSMITKLLGCEPVLTDDQWAQYTRDGFLNLGPVVTPDELKALQQRIDDIMLGKADVDYDRMMFQLDTETGRYEDAGPQTMGHKGATLNYRKIQQLEYDPLFLEYMQKPIFREICARSYGAHVPVGCFRAMFMNKPAHKGTLLPWHQDRWVHLDRDPLVTIWLALDPATVANGCVQLIPGSHKYGVVNPSHSSGFLAAEQAAQIPESEIVYMELKAGEAALLHNWTLHRSDVNRSDIPRRGFSVNYLDARTVARNGEQFPVIFGEGALSPQALREQRRQAQPAGA